MLPRDIRELRRVLRYRSGPDFLDRIGGVDKIDTGSLRLFCAGKA